jgi:hypothetical protein
MNREIFNVDQFRECLEDLGLLALAVPIPLSFDLDDLAVHVGGKRRGGELCVPDAEVGFAVIARLSTLPRFPDRRFVPGETARTLWESSAGENRNRHILGAGS